MEARASRVTLALMAGTLLASLPAAGIAVEQRTGTATLDVTPERPAPSPRSGEPASGKQPDPDQKPTRKAPDLDCRVSFFRGREYWFCYTNRTFAEARSRCSKQRMDLVEIDDHAENEFVHRWIGFDSWIGATAAAAQGDWVWARTGKPFWVGGLGGEAVGATYQNWDRWRFEDAPDRRCAVIDRSEGEWRDLDCSRRKDYVCEAGPLGQEPGAAPDDLCRREVWGDHAYWFCDNRRTFDQARRRCQAAGADLVTIDDAIENGFVKDHIRADSLLGLTDAEREGMWRWVAEDRLAWCALETSAPPTASSFGSWDVSHGSPYPRTLSGRDPAALPDLDDCAVIVEGLGHWRNGPCDQSRAYVCEDKVPHAGRTLYELARWVRRDHETGRQRVTHVQLPRQALVTDPFLRYGEDLGLRDCIDSMEPVGNPRALPHKGLEQLTYQQRYKGVPVLHTGYGVERDPTTGAVVSITGTVAHGMEVDTVPRLGEPKAFEIAFGRRRRDAESLAPRRRGRLVIVPTRYGPKSGWELAWLFSSRPVGKADGYTVAVSAASGKLVLSVPHRRRQCPSMDSVDPPGEGTERVTLEIEAFQQGTFGDPNTATATRLLGAGLDYPYLLSTWGLDPLDPDLAASLDDRPLIVARCPEEEHPFAVALETSRLSPVDETSPGNHFAAPVFMSAQRCLEHLAASLETLTAQPWIGYDGIGAFDIDIRLFDDPSHPGLAYYDPIEWTINFNVAEVPYSGASIESVCHEISHGVWDSVLGTSDDLPNRTLDEGLAMILGNTAEMRFRGYPGPGATPSGWCMQGDEYQNDTCLTDFADPAASSTGDGLGCPSNFSGPLFCRYPLVCSDTVTLNCCSAHCNSAVLSHWFYAITNGLMTTTSSCPDAVEPLREDLESSVATGLEILFRGLTEYYAGSARGGFPDLADSTITAARDLYGAGSPEMQTVIAGWYATNVRENFDEVRSELVEPTRGEEIVYPWKTFLWPAFGDETAWDVQVLSDLENPESFQFIGSDVGEERWRDGRRFGSFDLALPPDFLDYFYWRARPHLDEDIWTDCYPWHWFDATGAVEEVEEIEIVSELAADGRVRPGTVRFRWDPVDGARDYRVHVAQGLTGCVDGDDVIEPEVSPTPDEEGKLVSWVTGLQPSQTYWIHVQPVGPDDIDHLPTLGECATHEFTTTPMRAPILVYPSPSGGSPFRYESPHEAYSPGVLASGRLRFEWRGLDGPDEYDVRFFLRDASGACASTPTRVEVVDAPCRPSGENRGCLARLDEDLFPVPNPTGYCWEVVSLAANGDSSPASETGRFEFILPMVERIGPGMQAYYVEHDHLPAPLSGIDGSPDSWGRDVTFAWEPVTHAAGYTLKVGRWPWTRPVAPDPANCFDPGGSWCNGEPTAVVYREIVTGTSATLDGTLAATGRYCWTLWPMVEEPEHPGTVAEGQTVVFVGPYYSYTSGPAPPILDVEWPAATGFSSAPIYGTIELPYVPDGQWELTVSPEEDFSIGDFEEGCEVGPLYFRDLTGCIRPFTIFPREGRTYRIEVQTYNSPEVDPTTYRPILDEAYRVHRVTEEFTTGTCGQAGEPCCEGGDCDRAGLLCRAGTCVECGGRREPCCPGDDCDSGLFCDEGEDHCIDCGDRGEPCCNGHLCNSGSDHCEGGVCTRNLPDLLVNLEACRAKDDWSLRIENVGRAATGTGFTVSVTFGNLGTTVGTGSMECPALTAGEELRLGECTILHDVDLSGIVRGTLEISAAANFPPHTTFEESDVSNNVDRCTVVLPW